MGRDSNKEHMDAHSGWVWTFWAGGEGEMVNQSYYRAGSWVATQGEGGEGSKLYTQSTPPCCALYCLVLPMKVKFDILASSAVVLVGHHVESGHVHFLDAWCFSRGRFYA